MKKEISLFVVILFLFSSSSFGQTDMRENRHVFKFDVSLSECNFDGTLVTPTNSVVMKKDWKFRVRNILNDGKDYVIQISEFTDDNPTAKAQNELTYQRSGVQNIYFKMSSSQYLAFANELKRRGSFVVGASTTLIKIRPGNGKEKDDENVIYSEFGNDFNIGITAGWRINNYKDNVAVSIVGGLGFSSIKVTPQTTRDFISSESSQSAITFSGGLIFEVEKFQISTFVGLDTMSGEIGRNWIYKDRPWIGLGFGYEIFKPQGKIENDKP
ncbi:hypothetical protein [uncultured Flavobacterium sp.]|uniref:hypothetical protein n=1 Tax=uncultured Flavobacterium sp. TaxID=165435 RepID=UPI0030C83539